jgi:nucleoid DNA-binding protein
MNKSDLAKVLAKKIDLPLRKAEEIVDTVFFAMSRIGLRRRWPKRAFE